MVLEGGSGRAKIKSPSRITVKNGEGKLTIVWNSANYDYMIVDGKKYLNENPGKNSTFTVQIKKTWQPVKLIANTVAMSVPHEIEYTLYIFP